MKYLKQFCYLEVQVWKHHDIADIESLRAVIIEEWEKYHQAKIDRAINAFRKRVLEVIKANGGHIKKFK